MAEKLRTYGLYEKSPYIYDDYIPNADYTKGALRLTRIIREHNPAASTLLDVGSGTGKYIENLSSDFDCVGLDNSQKFLEIARQRNPGVPFHNADMCNFELGRKFDAISCLFLAIAYTATVERMEAAIASMARHLAPGGILIVEPWIYPENFWPNRLTSEYVEKEDLKIARMFIAKAIENRTVYDIHYLVGSPDGIEYFVEHEELGMFEHTEYQRAFERAGLDVRYEPNGGMFDAHNIGLYVGTKPWAQVQETQHDGCTDADC